MSELFFFNREVIQGLSRSVKNSLNPFLSRAIIPDGKPFILNNDGYPDKDLNGFFSYLCGPKRRSKNTWISYSSQIMLFIRFMDAQGKDWKEATKVDLNNYFILRTTDNNQNSYKKISGVTWNIAAAALILLYEYAKESNLIDDLPFSYRRSKATLFKRVSKDFNIPDIHTKTTSVKINFISIENYKIKWRGCLLQGQNAQRNLALTDLLISTGLRISEALNLKLYNIPDPDNQSFIGKKTVTIQIIGKGNKPRQIRIPKRIVRAINFYIEEDRNLTLVKTQSSKIKFIENVFISRNGKCLSKRTVETLFKNISKNLDLALTPHGCRHTFAVYQLEAMIKRMSSNLKEIKKDGSNAYRQLLNDPMRELQKLLGHSSISTVYTYLDFLEDSETLVDESFADWTNWENSNGI